MVATANNKPKNKKIARTFLACLDFFKKKKVKTQLYAFVHIKEISGYTNY